MSPPPECWDDRCAPLGRGYVVLGIKLDAKHARQVLYQPSYTPSHGNSETIKLKGMVVFAIAGLRSSVPLWKEELWIQKTEC